MVDIFCRSYLIWVKGVFCLKLVAFVKGIIAGIVAQCNTGNQPTIHISTLPFSPRINQLAWFFCAVYLVYGGFRVAQSIVNLPVSFDNAKQQNLHMKILQVTSFQLHFIRKIQIKMQVFCPKKLHTLTMVFARIFLASLLVSPSSYPTAVLYHIYVHTQITDFLDPTVV